MPDPSWNLADYVHVTGTYKAAYTPLPLVDKPTDGCDIPAFDTRTLTFPELPTIPVLDCNLNFVPIPTIAPPYIPPNLGNVCPDGFIFDSRYLSGTGDELLRQLATNVVRGGLSLISTIFDGYETDSTNPLPTLELKTLIESTGVSYSGLIEDAVYKVIITNYEAARAAWGVIYDSVTYTNGEIFTGKVTPTTADKTSNTLDISLYLIQERRVTNYDTATGDLTLSSSVSTGLYTNFGLQRLAIGFDVNRQSGGDIRFLNSGCGGKLIGDININPDNIDMPCRSGFGFDAGYTPTAGQDIVVNTMVSPAATGATNFTGSAVDFSALLPIDLPVDLSLHPNLVVTSGATTYKRKILSAGENYFVLSDTPVGTYAVIPPSATKIESTRWKIERILTAVSAGGSSNFLFSSSDCGGTLSGLINLDTSTITCAAALNETAGQHYLNNSDTPFSVTNGLFTGAGETLQQLNITKGGTSCANLFNITGNLTIPNIQITFGTAVISGTYDALSNMLTFAIPVETIAQQVQNIINTSPCKWS